MLVREFLHKAPVTVPPECTLEEAATLMALHDVGALLVVSEGALVGVVTDRDIVVRAVGAGLAPSARVEEVLTAHPATIQGSVDIVDAYRVLEKAGVRRLPVLEEGEVAGIVSVDDLLLALVLELGATLSPIARETLRRDIPIDIAGRPE
ncbi:MAG: CBS domain-containing protein [Actinomycetota bacterium]|jgi:CBS domain-containing protein|nr:CBS domain-containing protein [Actinomycetota bacterium]